MKIVFDAFWWTAGPASLRHVLRETVLAWDRCHPEDEITIVVRKKHFVQVRGEVPSRFGVQTSRLWPQALLATWACRRVQRRIGADVVITQNFAASTPATSVVFIHDVLFVTNPEWFTATERAYFSLMPRLAGRADLVLTSSATEAQRIREYSSVVSVTPVGIGMSTELISVTAAEPPLQLRPHQFVLTVGRLNVRKNLANTIDGAVRSGRLRPDFPLVVVGGANGRSDPLPPWVNDVVDAGLVVFAGFVADGQLRWLYENAALFLFLSRGEGFGMPVVEAMHFGSPLVVSDIAVLRELVPPDVPRVSPDDPLAIATAVDAAISAGLDTDIDPDGDPFDQEVRGLTAEESVRRSNLGLATDFSWDATVAAMRLAVLDCRREIDGGSRSAG